MQDLGEFGEWFPASCSSRVERSRSSVTLGDSLARGACAMGRGMAKAAGADGAGRLRSIGDGQ